MALAIVVVRGHAFDAEGARFGLDVQLAATVPPRVTMTRIGTLILGNLKV